MTKAFTSNLGDGITVKGYIDAEDRLVLLEPEGGGGGSGDFKLATCTLEGFSFGQEPSGEVFVYVYEDQMIVGIDNAFLDGMQLVLYGQTPAEISMSKVENCVFSGDCEFTPSDSGGTLTVTGDFTITKGA